MSGFISETYSFIPNRVFPVTDCRHFLRRNTISRPVKRTKTPYS